jgi:hypothetical protein
MGVTLERAIEIMKYAIEGRPGGIRNSNARYEGGMQIILENEGVTLGYWNRKYSEKQRMKSIRKARIMIDQATKIVGEQGL